MRIAPAFTLLLIAGLALGACERRGRHGDQAAGAAQSAAAAADNAAAAADRAAAASTDAAADARHDRDNPRPPDADDTNGRPTAQDARLYGQQPGLNPAARNYYSPGH